uniref:Uncharacterized protein n=1 Tax=Anguilla anguilla TaxID=7936 RepID=A0A0E9XAL3_ANGAN
MINKQKKPVWTKLPDTVQNIVQRTVIFI